MSVGSEYIDASKCNIRPVESLTEEEQKFQYQISQLHCRVEAGNRAAKEMKLAQERCTHRVFRDEPGFMYHDRYCVLCGAHLDLI